MLVEARKNSGIQIGDVPCTRGVDLTTVEARADVLRLIDERIPLQLSNSRREVDLVPGIFEEVNPRTVWEIRRGDSPSFTGRPIGRDIKGIWVVQH